MSKLAHSGRLSECVAVRPYLRLGEIELPGELGALAAHDVLAPLELELEPVQLLGGEGGPRALGPVQVEALRQDDLPDGAFGVCPECGREKRNVSVCRFPKHHRFRLIVGV